MLVFMRVGLESYLHGGGIQADVDEIRVLRRMCGSKEVE
jgi:hypothetical protein